jgi:hypothetical protein
MNTKKSETPSPPHLGAYKKGLATARPESIKI